MFLTKRISSLALAICASVSPALSEVKPTSTIEFQKPPERGPNTLLSEEELSQLEGNNPETAINANMFLFLGQRLKDNMSVETGLAQALTRARSLDLDGKPGIGFGDFILSYSMQVAQHRAHVIATELAYDLDADGRVTSEEAEVFARLKTPTTISQNGITLTLTPEQLNQLISKKQAKVMASDFNDDGVITLDEMFDAFNKNQRLPEWSRNAARPAANLRAFDANGDGVTTLQEVEDAYSLAISKVDQNNDGRFDALEIGDMMRTIDREFARNSGKKLQSEVMQVIRERNRN